MPKNAAASHLEPQQLRPFLKRLVRAYLMTDPSAIRLEDCWAKTDPVTGMPALTVRDHCLAVACVAEAVLKRLPPACLALPVESMPIFTGLHDIGKISPGFLRKAPMSSFAAVPGWQTCCSNHALVGQEFLASLPELQSARGKPFKLPLAIGGHHGRYPWTRVRNLLGRPGGPFEAGLTWPDALRHELLSELVEAFGPLPHEDIPKDARLHWLTGFVVFCDWIASNTDWFPLSSGTRLRDIWTRDSAASNAIGALDLIGWHRREVTSGLAFSQLFGSPDFQPRPLQQVTLDLVDEPGLYIIEAPMGVGKTEAALAAAYQRWTAGDERGLYFALPTQLTSNRIHDRIASFLTHTISDPTIQTLVHGNAWLSDDRARSFAPASTPDEPTDATEACRWFASSRKSLLAPFGTGTIDQALMSILSAKHSALRLFALSGKVIVIDEVHSYDPYTSSLIDRLVAWLRKVGCTVIILSATLTRARRDQLVLAARGTPTDEHSESYPLITKVTPAATSTHPVRDPDLREAEVRVSIHTPECVDWLPAAVAAAQAGACVLVIRNTVKLAQDTYLEARSALEGDHIRVALLHSRFPHHRRQKNEGEWTRLLGKNPEPSRPGGCILVATQVVEQSVDIDADVLFTDLAPTDLILQRLGRLHRHQRPRPQGFEQAHVHILVPEVDWDSDMRSAKEALGPSAWVYPPISLFLAETTWRRHPSVSLPTDIRSFLELPLPDLLPHAANEFATKLKQEVANMLSKAEHQDPFGTPEMDDSEGVQTRYNQRPDALLVILDALPEHPPLAFEFDLAKQLHEHATRIPRYLVAAALAHQPAWFRAQIDNAVLALRQPDSAKLDVIGREFISFQLSYTDMLGVTYEKDASKSHIQLDEPEDNWF